MHDLGTCIAFLHADNFKPFLYFLYVRVNLWYILSDMKEDNVFCCLKLCQNQQLKSKRKQNTQHLFID